MRAGMVAFIGLVIAGSSLVTTSSARAQGVSLLPGLSEPAERGPILGRALRPQRVEESEADEDRIETDRDSFTPSTRTVNFGRVVVESSYSYIDNREGRTRHSYPELLTRYGLTDWLELRIGGNYESGDGGGDVSGVESDEDDTGPAIEYESNVLYGLKAWLTDQRGLIPECSVLLQGFTPTSGRVTATELAVTGVIGWELPNRWKLDGSLRYATDHDGRTMVANYSPSVVLRVPVGELWTVHAEYFGQSSQGREIERVQHYFSTGPHALITRNLELGVRVGWGLNEQSSRFFSNAGVGWRY